ncbi:hypothetical protein [Agrobacterium cavarae]|uniref:hypothetical protein n=1 Tax=Agrobacterium cavarae TaxID=2528239 RepID=UPI0028A67952|nr:hypothetical protein [Agrobacterium cavarae]
MNRTLIKALDGLNNLLALFIILACAVVGFFTLSHQGGAAVFGAVVGVVVGLIVASIVCGLLATFIEIEKHLRALAEERSTVNSRTYAASLAKAGGSE